MFRVQRLREAIRQGNLWFREQGYVQEMLRKAPQRGTYPECIFSSAWIYPLPSRFASGSRKRKKERPRRRRNARRRLKKNSRNQRDSTARRYYTREKYHRRSSSPSRQIISRGTEEENDDRQILSAAGQCLCFCTGIYCIHCLPVVSSRYTTTSLDTSMEPPWFSLSPLNAFLKRYR